MNKNIENYKKAVEQIHVDKALKEKVLEKVDNKENQRKKVHYLRYVTAVAALLTVAIVSVSFLNKPKEEILSKTTVDVSLKKDELLANSNIKRFKNIQELKDLLKENEDKLVYSSSERSILQDEVKTNNVDSAVSEATLSKNEVSYSKTNNQVENVDEGDIVKTDGKYIYYVVNNGVSIYDTDLNLKSTILEENFSPFQIFINENKLVVMGNNYEGGSVIYNGTKEVTIDSVLKEDIETSYKPKMIARVYNIENIENPKLQREISIDGYYKESRMIGNYVYFISSYNLFFNRSIEELKDEDILPSYKDSCSKKPDERLIDANSIAYFDIDCDYNYSMIVGFNINNNEEAKIETFLGSGENIYVSENNMYIVRNVYEEDWAKRNSKIYKFNLKDGEILLDGSCDVDGYIKNQFSIDEYNGNLRVATTISNVTGSWETDDYYVTYTSKLTIFNEKLEKIGGIDSLIEDEEIYSVRFMGNTGYIVTFKEIDPLWIVDLSDPTNPVVKGELEIPGYSSYLHPWDENHIIGIGYSVKDNGRGGVTNDKLKISMFDISDISNPKEVFNSNYGNRYVYADIIYDHKELFINKEKNLIGFPVNWYNGSVNKTGLLLYRVDLENNKFEEISNMIGTGYGFVQRAIYIGDYIYNLFDKKIEQYNIDTFELVKTVNLEENKALE